MGRSVAFLLVLAVSAPIAAAQLGGLPAPSPLEPTPAPEPEELCVGDAACAGEERDSGTDCDQPTSWGRNDNATHAMITAPLTYTLVMAYDSCAAGEWWQENRGIIVVHHMPGLSAGAGGYTIESGDVDRTQILVVLFTPAGGADLRWTGETGRADPVCTMSLAASPAGYKVWDEFPCPLPPPDMPEAAWGNLIP